MNEMELIRMSSKVNKMDDEFDEVKLRIENYHKRLGSVEKALEDGQKIFNDIRYALKGDLSIENGGLIGEMKDVITKVDNLCKQQEDKHDWWKYIERTSVAGIIGYMFYLLKELTVRTPQ
jgi:hypothetical protein